ncbi:hypothetical protein N7E02_27810 [Aliirhizobium terrae]|uniref:hypothetical protein n=1 Tax=Terrirhizobium terrae TaxID=2926709 RepID=UPI0025765471|nr:hypothetical protein [Rhizobium sp. CC-CFT758]WJH40330.1 hypothetical protein N7E02_27810 [Rhizobium sp. CC-CFT758]
MALPAPEPGLVIRYDYLWATERVEGRSSGKDRPACLIATSDPAARPRYVVILPITHSRPAGKTIGIEIPPKVKQAIGLDEAPSWVIVSEYNIDEWPNAGLSPIPGSQHNFAYGFLPPGLFKIIKENFLELARDGKSRSVRR